MNSFEEYSSQELVHEIQSIHRSPCQPMSFYTRLWATIYTSSETTLRK